MKDTSGNHERSFPQLLPQDRRSSSRFPITEDVTYQYRHGKVSSGGYGRCINIGSGGVMFTTSNKLPIGRTVQVSINWPALLNGACPLRFIASGPVVRAEEGRAVVRIDRYEFRTRGVRSNVAAALSAARGPAGLSALDTATR